MKRTIFMMIAFYGLTFSLNAQNNLGKTDDLGRLAIAAIVPAQAEGIPPSAHQLLVNKMGQIAVQNGLGAMPVNPRFCMIPLVNVLEKEITPTAPPMQALTLDITFYIVDALSQNIFSQTSIQAKGVGQTEDKAYIQAIREINIKSGQFKGFVERGKEKIIEFYNSQCDVILKNAQALAGQKQYEESLFVLLSVPDVCRECYDKCMDLSIDIYQQYADYKCTEYLSGARASWANMDVDRAAEYLGKITPDMQCYKEASQLADQITQKQIADGANVWQFKMKKYDDSIEKDKMMIQAVKEVGKSWAYWGAAPYFNWDWSWIYTKK